MRAAKGILQKQVFLKHSQQGYQSEENRWERSGVLDFWALE